MSNSLLKGVGGIMHGVGIVVFVVLIWLGCCRDVSAAQENALVSEPVIAQGAQPGNGAVSVGGITDAVSVSGNDLEQSGVYNGQGLANLVPGLNYSTLGQVFIRGIGSTATSEKADSAVSINVNNIYIPRPRSIADTLFFDVDHIDVLKGPQGTQFGRNASGGVINVVDKAPQFSNSAQGSIDLGTYNSVIVQSVGNAQVTDTLAVRAAVQTQYRNGYETSANALPIAENSANSKAGRLSILYDLSDSFSVLLRGDVRQDHGLAGTEGLGSTIRVLGVFTQPRVIAQFVPNNDSHIAGGSAEMNWQIGPGTVTSVTGYRSVDTYNVENMPVGIFTLPFSIGTTMQDLFNEKDTTLQQDLRYAGTWARLKYLFGAGYFREDQSLDNYIGASSGDFIRYLYPTVQARSYAAFTDQTYALTDQWRVSAGMRFTHDDKSRHGTQQLWLGSSLQTAVFNSVSGVLNTNAHWNVVTWNTGMDYDLTPAVTLFGSVSTGYKAGGFNDGLATSPQTYAPENLLAYQVGAKTHFLDDRVVLNASAYYYDYSNLQIESFGNSGAFITSVVINAAKAEVYGLDLDAKLTPWDGGQFTGALNLNHAAYLAWNDTAVNNLNGKVLPYAPLVSATLGYEHQWSTPSLLGDLTARLQTHLVSRQNYDYRLYAATEQGAYSKTDLSLTWTDRSGLCDVMLYVRNIEDDTVMSAATSPSGFPNAAVVDYAPPRFFGVRLGLKL